MSKRLGAGVSSAHSLASDTSEGTHRRVTRKGGKKETAISPAGSNARSYRAAARARNQSAANSASSPSASVPQEVVTTRLYKRGRLIKTAPSNLRPSAQPPCMLIYSDDDEKELDAVDDDEDYVEKNFTSFPPPAKNVRRTRVLGGPQPPDTSNMSPKEEKKALARFEKERR